MTRKSRGCDSWYSVVLYAGLKLVGMAASKTDVEFVLRVQDGVCTAERSGPDHRRVPQQGQMDDHECRLLTAVHCPQNFKHPLGGDKYDPAEKVVKPEPVTAGPIGTGQTTTIDARVIKSRLLHKHFKYQHHAWGDGSEPSRPGPRY